MPPSQSNFLFVYWIILLFHYITPLYSQKWKRSVRSNLCFSVTETKNFLEEMRDVLFFSFFSFFFQSMDIWPSKFMFLFLPRTCKRMIGGLLGRKKGSMRWRSWDAEEGKEGNMKSIIHGECVCALREKRIIPLLENFQYTQLWTLSRYAVNCCTDCIKYH